MGCLLKRLPEILGRAKNKYGTLQLFYFDQNAFERARANATIRKYVRFMLDFAPQHFEIDTEVAELAKVKLFGLASSLGIYLG